MLRSFLLLIPILLTGNLVLGQIKVGVITDFEQNAQSQELVNSIILEIDRTTGSTKKIISPSDIHFFGISNIDEAKSVYQGLLGTRMVISLGAISTKALSELDKLPVPVIGIGIIDPYIQNIPYQDGSSGKTNFTYIWPSKDILSEIKTFKRLHEFKELTVVLEPSIQQTIDPERTTTLLDSIQQSLNVKVRPVAVAESIEQTVAQIGSAEAVFLSVLNSRDQNYISALSDYLIEKKIPSYTVYKQHVDLGILSATADENGWEQITRRIAIIADAILSGADISKRAVSLSTKDEYYLNLSTARKIEFSPPFEILFTANLVGDISADAHVYSFNEIAKIALEENLDIQVSYQDIDLATLDIKLNRSILYPSISSNLVGSQINEERANAAANTPERSLNVDVSLTQLIYSPQAIAAIKIATYLQNAQEYQTEIDILNVLLDVYQAYLDVLTAKTNVTIQRKNLENTRTNLELAKIRVDIGSANNADLYRWESELANASQALIEAQTLLLTTKLRLNTLLANTLEQEYEISDISIDGELFQNVRSGPITEMINTPKDMNVASDFLVEETLKRNPNKKVLSENINAAERQLALNKQLFYQPTVSLQAQVSNVLARGGKGSEITDPSQEAFGGLQDNSWFVGASISYPIFTGFSRNINKKKSMIQLEQLTTTNINLEQNLELSVRANMLSLLTATTNLNYSKISAESANQNFLLIQSNYKSGNVNITQVIDAQQAAVSEDLAAAISVYEYMLANLQLEYSVGFFSMFSTEKELEELKARFINYISTH